MTSVFPYAFMICFIVRVNSLCNSKRNLLGLSLSEMFPGALQTHQASYPQKTSQSHYKHSLATHVVLSLSVPFIYLQNSHNSNKYLQ